MKKYLVHTPLSNGVNEAGKIKSIAAGKTIDRDPADEETKSLVACGAISEVPSDDVDADGDGKPDKKPAKK